jgi:uracil-DNA glycosylase
MSHKGRGWETFTDAVIRALNRKTTPVVFLLWGGHAQTKRTLIENPLHSVLTAPHPSPLSAYRGFFGCRAFSRTNEILAGHGISPIRWDALHQKTE